MRLARGVKEAARSAKVRFSSIERSDASGEIGISRPDKRREQLIAVGRGVLDERYGNADRQYGPDGRANRRNGFKVRRTGGQAQVTQVARGVDGNNRREDARRR